VLFYLDENVPAKVERVLSEAGHTVVWTRDITGQGAPDIVVATVAEEQNATLVSHDKDFKKIAPLIPDGQKARFRKLSIVRLMCEKPRSAQRLAAVLRYIEFDYERRADFGDKRSIIEVKKANITFNR
jgi:predicted nuclease of predicted toxin-antitoxin system